MALPASWQYGSQGPTVWRAFSHGDAHCLFEEASSQAAVDALANSYYTFVNTQRKPKGQGG